MRFKRGDEQKRFSIEFVSGLLKVRGRFPIRDKNSLETSVWNNDSNQKVR